MTFDRLRADDLHAALALSAAEGWNQSATDWSRLIGLEPSGCFAARDGGRLAGTVTTITYGRALAWIGMMVVHPEHRRRGLGATLMKMALDHAHDRGIRRVKLDATPAGRPLYESLGFAAETEVGRWQGVARPHGTSEPPPGRSSPETWLALDRAAYGADRSRLLERLVAEGLGEPLVVSSGQSADGYVLARRGRAAIYLGPLVATGAAAATHLLDTTLARFAGEEICLDLVAGGWLEPDALAQRGLSRKRALTRMGHGLAGDGGAQRLVCASAGPELG